MPFRGPAATGFCYASAEVDNSTQAMKYLLWIALILIVLWLIRQPAIRQARKPKPPAAREPEKMVKCAHCGVHLPESESLRDDGAHYCSAEHRRAAHPSKT